MRTHPFDGFEITEYESMPNELAVTNRYFIGESNLLFNAAQEITRGKLQ